MCLGLVSQMGMTDALGSDAVPPLNTTLYMHDCLPMMLWEDGFHLWEPFQGYRKNPEECIPVLCVNLRVLYSFCGSLKFPQCHRSS